MVLIGDTRNPTDSSENPVTKITPRNDMQKINIEKRKLIATSSKEN
jgi:hypothetical protein